MTNIVSAPARVAGPGEGIGLDELALAARNHGLPLEAMRYDVTPPGLHYLLTHYDIPATDEASWRGQVTGRDLRALGLAIADPRRAPPRPVPVPMERAGNEPAPRHPPPAS